MKPRTTYRLMLALLMTHEIDAAFLREWRILPVTSILPDELARHVFTWGHVPLFFIVLLCSSYASFRAGLSAFSVVHIFLHWLLRNHPANAFNNITSWFLIIGAGVMGAVYLLQSRRHKPDRANE